MRQILLNDFSLLKKSGVIISNVLHNLSPSVFREMTVNLNIS